MKTNPLLFLLLFLVISLQACREKQVNVNSHLSLDDYASLDTSAFRLSERKIRAEIDSMARWDRDSMVPDYRVRSHYRNQRPLVWIDRRGVDSRADSVVKALGALEAMGMSKEKFRVAQIERDLRRLRTLDFDNDENNINKVAGRLEYNLTKAYLRYVAGQRFGFANPRRLLNKLDVADSSGGQTTYQTLFDIKTDQAGPHFYEHALQMVHQDSVGTFMRQVEPHGQLYDMLARRLAEGGLSLAERTKILVNMERCRWRMPDYPERHEKYVMVNIPSFHLQAVDGDSVLSMRIAFGAMEHKTPLMISRVKRMDINPQWIMPRSIIKKSILPRVGNVDYFVRHRYFVRNRETGEVVNPHEVTRAMIESGDYWVIQRGGEGNALGRIIFRFDNNLSIYLHDTSSRSVFDREARDVSHGCVRVQKPFALAKFMMADKDEKLIDKISYSMQADVSPLNVKRSEMTDEMKAVADTLDRNRLIGQVKIEPQVPIFILYYTLYPDATGKLESMDDVYGYDRLIYSVLRNYI